MWGDKWSQWNLSLSGLNPCAFPEESRNTERTLLQGFWNLRARQHHLDGLLITHYGAPPPGCGSVGLGGAVPEIICISNRRRWCCCCCPETELGVLYSVLPLRWPGMLPYLTKQGLEKKISPVDWNPRTIQTLRSLKPSCHCWTCPSFPSLQITLLFCKNSGKE